MDKGQASVELVMVVGMMLVLSSPFILASQSSLIELRDASRFLKLDQSMKEIRHTAQDLNSSSFPARRVLRFQTPSGVEKIYNPNFTGGSALIFEVKSRGERTNRSLIFDLELNLTEKGSLASEGAHKVSLRKARSQINMTVIS